TAAGAVQLAPSLPSDAEGCEIHAVGDVVDLTAHPGGKELLPAWSAPGDDRGGVLGQVGVEPGIGGVTGGPGELRRRLEPSVVHRVVEMGEVRTVATGARKVAIKEDVEEVVGVEEPVVDPAGGSDALRLAFCRCDLDVDPDRRQVRYEDLSLLGAEWFAAGGEHGRPSCVPR